MFTPQEVSEKTFPKASGFNNGYGMAAVDEFLDALTEDYTALYKDNAALKAKLKVLAEKVEEYRATEDAMRSTLLSAQRMAAQMVSDAQAQRDKMLSDAQEEANRQVAQLEQQVAQAQHKLTMAQASLSDFLRRSADLCAQQVSFLRSLPEAEVEEGQPVTLPAPEEGRVPVADAAEEPAAPVEEAPAEDLANCLIFPYKRARATRQLWKKYTSVTELLSRITRKQQIDSQLYYNLVVQSYLLEEKLGQNANFEKWEEFPKVLSAHQKKILYVHKNSN